MTTILPKEIIVNLTFAGGEDVSAAITYDHDWNVIDNLVWSYRPNEGQAIRLPLEVGKTWRADFEAKNLRSGSNFKGSSSSKVVAMESVPTPVGVFDAFKIERQVKQFSAASPSRLWESEITIWYAPQINHWARRTTLVKFEKRVRSSTQEELADFTRKL